MKTLLLGSVILTLACAVPAQSLYHVSPASCATVEGNDNNNYPFFYPFPSFTYMQVHDDLPKKVLRISALGFRRDINGGTSYTVPAWTATLAVQMSTARTTSASASSVFAGNHGADRQTVLASTTVPFPASAGGPMPKNFVTRIVFTKPFIFPNNPATPKSLCFELRINGHTIPTSSYVLHDAAGTNPSYTPSQVGTGGVAVGQTQPAYCNCFAAFDGQLRLYGFQYLTGITTGSVANKPFLWVGLSRSKWGPLPLPFDLSPLGGQGNTIYTDMLLLLVAQGNTDAKGYYNWYNEAFRVPNDPSLSPLNFTMQMASTDLANPQFPFVFTRACGMAVTINPVLPVCRIYNSSSATATSGGLQPGYGLVTRFEYY